MSLETINNVSEQQAARFFYQCCSATAWVKKMVASRPYASREQLMDTATTHWQGLSEQDYLQAFDGHPKIGDVNSLKHKYTNTKVLAAGEQSGVEQATGEVIQALAEGNAQYQQKFGFIFIVCATGKSAKQMLYLLQQRLPNDRDTELVIAAQEQQKIFQIRLEKLL